MAGGDDGYGELLASCVAGELPELGIELCEWSGDHSAGAECAECDCKLEPVFLMPEVEPFPGMRHISSFPGGVDHFGQACLGKGVFRQHRVFCAFAVPPKRIKSRHSFQFSAIVMSTFLRIRSA